MKQSIIEELTAYVAELVADGVINDDNREDAHFHAFNEDYYIVGYWNAEKWLEKHDVSAWEAIQYVVEKELELFGENTLDVDDMNAERVVNLIAYHVGEEIDFDSIIDAQEVAA